MTSFASLGELRQSAAEAFVRTAILIDNEPSTSAPAAERSILPMVARTAAYGASRFPQLNDTSATSDAGEITPAPSKTHELRVLPVTNAFSSRRITCGFYFPGNEDEHVVETALAAARNVDATIVDWHLRPNDTAHAIQLIKSLLDDDNEAGGRLRLIVVYTAERGLDAECKRLKDALEASGMPDVVSTDQDRALRVASALITFANKPLASRPELEPSGPGARPVPWDDLPRFVLGEYARLAEGLLQSFALKAIGAVRDDTHHLLTVFGSDLDGAYLAQRAGISNPSDAEEMMTALLTSEFAMSIVERGLEAEMLGAPAAKLVLTPRDPASSIKVKRVDTQSNHARIVVVPKQGAKHILANADTLSYLVEFGIDEKAVELADEQKKELTRQFFNDDAKAHEALTRFARLTAFSREAESSRRPGRKPVLTGGIILRHVDASKEPAENRFLLCVQPGCDAVRLEEDTAFPFCPLKHNAGSFDIVLKAAGTDVFLKIDRRPRSLKLLSFSPDAEKKVVSSEEHEGRPGFWTADRAEFWEFLAELRGPEAQHFVTQLVGKFNRIALNGSEWLRTHAGSTND